MDELELKHWGILNMKWGIRRFQNPDGSLTPEGRKRYGVGPARNPEKMSDDELYKESKRNKALANYYNAQNDYIRAKAFNSELSKPKKRTNQFLQNIFVKPVETVLSKSIEFGLYTAADSFIGLVDSKSSEQYMNFVLRNNKDKNKDKDKDKDS